MKNLDGDSIEIFLEVFFPVFEIVFVALQFQDLAQLRGSAEEDGDLALLLRGDLLEHFVPVRASGVRPGLESGDQVSF